MRNATYEQALTKQGITFTYHENISLEDIDRAKGIRNQARLLVPIEDELVSSYALAYQDGMEFPPLVLHRFGKGRYVPVDGNNRLAACEKIKRLSHDAYVVEVQDQMVVDRLTWTFNNLVNGKRLGKEECLEHAISFCQKYGYTQEASAKEWGLPLYTVRKAVRANKLREVLQRHGVKKMPNDNNLDRLSPLEAVGEDVFVAAATVVAESGVGEQECLDLVRSVKQARTNEAKLKAVDDFAKSEFVKQRRAETKGGRVQPPRPMPRNQLKRLVEQANRLFEDYPEPTALRTPKPEYKQAREDAALLANRLITLYGLGALLNGQEAAS